MQARWQGMNDSRSIGVTMDLRSGTVEIFPCGLPHRAHYYGQSRSRLNGGPFSLIQLKSFVDQHDQFLDATTLEIDAFILRHIFEVIILGELLGERLPNLKTLALNELLWTPDVRIFSLLKRVSPHISKLVLKGACSDRYLYERTFRRIGQLKQLRSLVLVGWSKQKFEDLPVLVESLGSLPLLGELEIRAWNLLEPPQDKCCLEPLLRVLENKQTMRRVVLEGIRKYKMDRRNAFSFDDYSLDTERMQAVQFWPRINQATRNMSKVPDESEDWVEALILVKDRTDCFHYLFSQLSPHTYTTDLVARRRRPREYSSKIRKCIHVLASRFDAGALVALLAVAFVYFACDLRV